MVSDNKSDWCGVWWVDWMIWIRKNICEWKCEMCFEKFFYFIKIGLIMWISNLVSVGLY